jgi:hypothetical protein
VLPPAVVYGRVAAADERAGPASGVGAVGTELDRNAGPRLRVQRAVEVGYYERGSRTVKRLPLPSRDSAVTRPP